MVEIDITYQGELRCNAVHRPSGTTLVTDAPVDNHGKGESFSPTDLVATALGTCILTVMGVAARSMQVDLAGARVHVTKEMTPQPFRRIARLTAIIEIPAVLDDDKKQKLMKAAMSCPVHASLNPDIEKAVEFRWAT